MSGESASTRLRERGNLYYGRAAATEQADGKFSLLHVAKSLYEEALQMAGAAGARASAHKNLGATFIQLAGLSSTAGSTRQLLLQSVHHKCQAYVTGREAHKSDAWLAAAKEGIPTAIDMLMEQLAGLLRASPGSNMGQVLQQLAELHSVIPGVICELRGYASELLIKSVRDVAAQLIATTDAAAADGEGARRGRAAAPAEADWRGCLQLLAEANRPLIEALQLALDLEDGNVITWLLQLEDELYMMECRARSTQERLQGEQLMQRTLRQRSDRLDREEAAPQAPQKKRKRHRSSNARTAAGAAAEAAAEAEACELDGLLSALDLLKSAALLAKERDLQAEAQALSSLGHLYKVTATILDPILVPHRASAETAGNAAHSAAAAGADALLARSAEERSRDAFLRVLLLVDALPHKISLMMEDWYREARDSISEYQRSRAAAEEQQREAERAPVREALRAELQALYDAANRGWTELIKHCYDKHPPLNPANRLAPGTVFDAAHGKELLRRAILAYHPDKQGAAGVAFSWKVLAEEITKQLTLKYECFK